MLLSLVTDFVTSCTARLTELNKKYPQDGKVVELLDLRSHLVSITLHFLDLLFDFSNIKFICLPLIIYTVK